MKGKFLSEARNQPKMPWSKIVKRYQPDKAIQSYILEDVGSLPEMRPNEINEIEKRDDRTHIPPGGADYQRGFYEGEAKGFVSGKTAGFVTGEVKGFTVGKVKGFADGEAKGLAEGKAQGFAEGEAKGFAEGKTEGFAEGEAIGKKIREEELQKIEATHQLLLRFVEDFKDLTETYVSEAEQELLQIVMAVAQKVIRKELQNDEALVPMIQTALKKVSPIPAVLIRVHPDDVERLTQRSPEILEAVGGIGSVRIEPDPKLTPGDSIVETEDRIVDMRPDTQLAAIEKTLLSHNTKEPDDETSSCPLPGSD